VQVDENQAILLKLVVGHGTELLWCGTVEVPLACACVSLYQYKPHILPELLYSMASEVGEGLRFLILCLMYSMSVGR
jgi:hypothetical protein